MSLSYQINSRILLSALFILAAGAAITLWHARSAINDEIDSSVNVTAHIIACGLSQRAPAAADWLDCISSLKETRHLKIELLKSNGEILEIGHKNKSAPLENPPPAWFAHLAGGKKAKLEKPFTTPLGEQFSLSIQANPLDEIKEVWEESLGFFGTILVLTQLAFLSVYLALNKSIKAINTIVSALQAVESGQYRQALPEFETSEYNSIAKAINHMTAELGKAQQENRALAQHSLEIQESERKQLAQELHDELGQSLTAIKMMAVTASRKPSEIKPMTEAIAGLCDSLINVVRTMMRQLHPLVLTELGLRAALEDLITHWTARNPALKLTLNCAEEVDELPQSITIHIFRAVQECLTNIVRHAEASEASIIIKVQTRPGKQLCLTVADNGKGCAPEKLKNGFGLLGLKERINSLDGQLTIQNPARRRVEDNCRHPFVRKQVTGEYC